jgi:hypothetical protein
MTILALCTFFSQAESRRLEGILYGEYWAALQSAGFYAVELPLWELFGPLSHPSWQTPKNEADQTLDPCGSIEQRYKDENGTVVRAWVIARSAQCANS